MAVMAGVLSARLTPDYMLANMGGLDGADDEGDRVRLQDVEEYSDICSEQRTFVVDRSGICDASQTAVKRTTRSPTVNSSNALCKRGIRDF